MKISEKLAKVKQMEGELMRLYNLRDTVAKQTIGDADLLYKDDSEEIIAQKKKEFKKSRLEKVNDITLRIDKKKESIIKEKNLINLRNLEMGLDKKLIEMKYLRIELSKLMKLTQGSRYSSDSIDLELWEELGMSKRLKDLERKKSKLDAEIQSANWATIS